MKPHAWTLALTVVLMGVAGGWLVSRGLAEETHEVQVKDDEVIKNFDIDKNDEEPVAPESVESLDEGKIKITTKTFKPPSGWKFKEFTSDSTPTSPYDRRPFNPGQYVDIEIDPECLPPKVEAPTVRVKGPPPAKEGPEAIKVVVTELTVPPTAGNFPLKCEGNLQPPPGGQGSAEFHWSAKVSRIEVELDIREHGRQTNRIGREDPRLSGGDALARNKLLAWHNEGPGHKVTFDLVKPPDISGTFRVRIEDKSGTNQDLPTEFDMDTDSWTGTYNIAWNLNYGSDVAVKYGLDANGNGSLSDDEVMGQYEVFGISAADRAWAESRIKNWFIPFALYDLADAITWRFVYGSFQESEYDPTSSDQTYVVSAYDLAHPFGATAAADGFTEINDRMYFKAKMTLPVYYYAPESAGAELVRGSDEFLVGINSFIAKLTWAQVDAAYKADPDPGPTKAVDFAGVQTSFDFGPIGSIGLGGANSTGGNLTLNITPVGDAYRIEAGATVAALRIEDIFDYNYFTQGWLAEWSEAPLHAASVQCGFGRYDVVDGVGQVALIRIDVSGEVPTAARIIPKP